MEEKSECKDCRTWEEEMYWKHFNSMHFCQSLPSDFHDHLVLPKKFSSYVKTQLPDKVSLKGPSGVLWEIDVLKTDDLLFVGSGWKEFVKANDLSEHCLLMFKYKRNSLFKVLIFDQGNSCEKEITYFIKKCRHTKVEQEDQRKRTVTVREASSTEIIESESDEDCAFVIPKKSRKDDGTEISLDGKTHTQTPRHVSYAAARGRGRGRGRGRSRGRGSGKPRRVLLPCNSPGKPKVISKNRSIRSETGNKPSQLSQGDLISPENGESSLKTNPSQNLEGQSKESLYANDAAKEPSKSARKLINPENGEKSPIADQSQKSKSQSEKLPNGNDTENEMSHISESGLIIIENGKDSPDGSHISKPQSAGKRSRINETLEDGKYSPVTDRSDRVKGQAEKEPVQTGTVKAQTQYSACGLIRPDYREDSEEEDQSSRTRGKRVRSTKHELPKSSKKLVFKSASIGRLSKEYISNRRPVTEEEKVVALRKAVKKETENSFTAIMRPSYVYKRFFLHIPGKWLCKRFLRGSQEVVLRVGENTWLTTLFYSGTKGGGIAAGWKRFAVENNLEEFDVLVFTLVNQKDEAALVIDVDIFRVVSKIVPLLPVT